MPLYVKEAESEAAPGLVNRGAVRRQGGCDG
jgi:hypothetical protein